MSTLSSCDCGTPPTKRARNVWGNIQSFLEVPKTLQICGCGQLFDADEFLENLETFLEAKNGIENQIAKLLTKEDGEQVLTHLLDLETVDDFLIGCGDEDDVLLEDDLSSTIDDPSQFQETTEKISSGRGDNCCDKCGRVFETINSLKAHKKIHLRDGLCDDGSFQCPHCSSVFEELPVLKEHRKRKHEDPRDYCPICHKQFSKGVLQTHLHTHDGKLDVIRQTIKCFICSKLFDSPRFLAFHMNVHKGDFSCHDSECKRSFLSSTAAKKHAEEAHNEDFPVKQCNYCNETFFSGTVLFDEHIKKHEESIFNSKFLCDICGSSFLTKKSLQTHLRLTHNARRTKDDAENTCEVCGKIFATEQWLRLHRRTHLDNTLRPTPFNCKVEGCEKSFSSKACLDTHVMVHHSGEMRYKCRYCDCPGFTYAQGLRTHMYKMHKEVFQEQRFCQICYKLFSTDEEFITHEESHDRLKCSVCKKQFKSMNHLKEHTVRHASVLPFPCPYCPNSSRGFVRRKQLLDHLKKVHPEEEEPTTPAAAETDISDRITYVIHLPS